MGDQSGIVSDVFDCVIYDGEIDALAIRLHDQAKAVHARDQALREALQASIDGFAASTSWRVTVPLRAAAGLVRGRGA